jgi:hypothetical protein
MNEPVDMLSEEWMDEFERNWGLLRTDRNNPSGRSQRSVFQY